MKVGFTGTQSGMDAHQYGVLRHLLGELKATEFHHGDCIGADAQAHDLACSLDIPVTLHPPDDPKKRAFCVGAYATRPPAPYLVRNRRIVSEVEVMIATPGESEEKLRSGTWSTIRHTKRVHKSLYIIYPKEV